MNSPALSIRPAVAADVGMVLQLIRELAEYERSPVSATETALLRDGFGPVPRFHVLIAFTGDEAVGFAFYAFTYSTYTGAPVLFLEDLFVRPPQRGHGIGLALMRAVAAVAIEKGCARLALETLDWNEKAPGFYQGLGGEVRRERLMVWLRGDALGRLAGG